MTIFSIIQSQVMRRAKKPGKPRKNEDTVPPENPDNHKDDNPKE